MTSCISLTGVKDGLPHNKVPNAKIGELIVYYSANNSGYCITYEQKMFLRQAIEMFAPFKSAEVVEITINQKMEGNPFINGFWVGASVGSFGIIPFLSTEVFNIKIASRDQGGMSYQYQYEQKNLMSLFALPLMISNSIDVAHRNNIEYGIFEALKRDGSPSNDISGLKHARVCSHFGDTSMPW